MKISTRTEYGIRVLVTLARHSDAGPLSLTGIARIEKLPHAYLEQLVGDLRRAGLVHATRGQSGGYQLNRSAESISIAEVVRALDGPLLEMPCAGADDLESCDRPHACSVHEVFQRVQKSLVGTLGETTLQQVAATAGGPPYPIKVRKRHRAANHETAPREPSLPEAALREPALPEAALREPALPEAGLREPALPEAGLREPFEFTSGDHQALTDGPGASRFTPDVNSYRSKADLHRSEADLLAQRTPRVNSDASANGRASANG